jgi:hypothetical protein
MPIVNLPSGKTMVVPSEAMREVRLLIWAAKCHVHQQAIFPMRMGTLVHSSAEVQAAIDALDVGPLKLAPCTDEGVKQNQSQGR